MIRPQDRISARHEGQILVGTVVQLQHGAGTVTVLTDQGVATIPLDAIVAVEPVATILRRAKGYDPAHPDEQPMTDGLSLGEWMAFLGICGLGSVAGAAVAGGILGIGYLVFRAVT